MSSKKITKKKPKVCCDEMSFLRLTNQGNHRAKGVFVAMCSWLASQRAGKSDSAERFAAGLKPKG